MIRSIFKKLLVLIAILTCCYLILISVTKPSLKGDWAKDQSIMPNIGLVSSNSNDEVDKVIINNIRSIHYRTTEDYDLKFYNRTINLEDIETAWLGISPFGGFGIAHTFVSFGLKDGTYLSISVELRRKKGTVFSPLKGFLRQFEVMYVIADETDVIKLRTNKQKETVRLFPVNADKALIQSVFLDMVKRADTLGKEPEFYNTAWNNCTVNIIRHTKRFSIKSLPFWDYTYLVSEDLDKLAYELDIIDTKLSYEDTREHFDITKIAQSSETAVDFSKAIRANMINNSAE